MSLDLATLDHTCNVVRRQIEDEFKNLTALFIVHNSGERAKTITDKRNTIFAKPNGRKIYDFLGLSDISRRDKSEFMGIIVHNNKFLNLFAKKHYTSVFFINADEFGVSDNVKHQLYHMAWHALNIMEDIRLNHAQHKFKNSAELVRPEKDKLKLAQNNLMADVFGAILMEAQGHDRYIKELASKRSSETLNPAENFIAELYAYPIAYEACQLIYDDLKSNLDKKTGLLAQVMDLSIEVASTYGETALKQWIEFSKPTQEMVWLGYTPEQILGQAIYTSNDTHVRATAYMIAESMNIEPQTDYETIPYNPFLDNMSNKRLHDRASDEFFQLIASQALDEKDSTIFIQAATDQNIRLMDGHVTGWCALAYLKSAEAMKEKPDITLDEFTELYFKYKTSIDWEALNKLSKVVLFAKRAGLEINKSFILGILNKDLENYSSIQEAFTHETMDLDNIEENKRTDTKKKDGIAQFINSSNLARARTAQ